MKEKGAMKNKAVITADIGAAVRKKRKEDGLTLADAAALCGVGYRFMSDLENGKATVQVGKVLQVLTALGLDVTIEARNWSNE
ncbi:MAG TPA: transcriptional regulator [Syntrophus sp. (in: bacteria)]|nr:transcriptional regulator [Syntrophus sp. (in: bacteria)]